MSISKSQIGQDLNVLKHYKNKRGGTFIEIGAHDGIEFSNTYLLENGYGWSGLCVEPNPYVFNKLQQNRPNSKCCDAAIHSESGKVLDFDIALNENMFSGLSSTIDRHRDRVDKNKETIKVTTLSLTDLLDKYAMPSFIEYLSLDTEGSELDILKTFNFNKYRFGLIDIEHNFIEPRRSQIRQLLKSNGYNFVMANQFDDCYRHSSI